MAIRNILSTPDWHDSVDGYTALAARNKGPKIATSYNSSPLQSPSPLPSLRSSRPGQIAVFSPYGPSSGSTLFASNPYLAPAFTGAPQPALTSPPPPVFAGPQAPTCVTNIYNAGPQPQTTAAPKSHTKTQLLGGVLKVVAAIITHGASLGI